MPFIHINDCEDGKEIIAHEISTEQWIILINLLNKNKAKRLIFDYTYYFSSPYEDEIDILSALKKNTSLEHVQLKGTVISKKTLAELVSVFDAHPTLQSLIIRNYSKEETNVDFYRALCSMLLNKNSKIERLALEHMDLNQDISYFCDALEQTKTLKYLHFYAMKFPPNKEQLINVLKKNNSIMEISCRDCEEGFAEELEKISFFKKGHYKDHFVINDEQRTMQHKSARQIAMSLLWQDKSDFKPKSIFMRLPVEIRYRIACERIQADCPWVTQQDAVLFLDQAIKDKTVNFESISARMKPHKEENVVEEIGENPQMTNHRCIVV